MNSNDQNSSTPTLTPSEAPRTAGDVAKELGKSVTTIKALAVQTNATVAKTPGGVWVFFPPAVEKLRQEITRREQEQDRR